MSDICGIAEFTEYLDKQVHHLINRYFLPEKMNSHYKSLR